MHHNNLFCNLKQYLNLLLNQPYNPLKLPLELPLEPLLEPKHLNLMNTNRPLYMIKEIEVMGLLN
jgi:hypothetical protein